MAGWLSGATERYSPKQIQSVHGSASYVTGSHNIKVGMTGLRQWTGTFQLSDADWRSLWVIGGAPITAIFWGSSEQIEWARTFGFYGQYQWTVNRLTANAGLRVDHVEAGYPDQVRPVSTWVREEFQIPGQTVVSWKDLQPRLGLAYDLFGNGKTALKGSASRYGKRDSTDRAQNINPAIANREMRRTWNDRTCVSDECIPGDGIPQGDPLNPLPNGELLSPNTNLAFGRPIITRFYDPEWASGWGNRPSNWEFTGSAQHELMPSVSVDVGYFHRRYINFDAVDDRVLGPEDYDRFTAFVPDDPRIPVAPGSPITLVDLKPSSIRLANIFTTGANNFGGQSRSWNGVDLTGDARVRGILFQGGLSTGSLSSDNCDLLARLPENPSLQVPAPAEVTPLNYCRTRQNWLTQIKLLGSYTLPYGVQLAGTVPESAGAGAHREGYVHRCPDRRSPGTAVHARCADRQRRSTRHRVRRAVQSARSAVHEGVQIRRNRALPGDVRHLQPVQRERDDVRGARCRPELPAASGDHAGPVGQVRLPDRLLI